MRFVAWQALATSRAFGEQQRHQLVNRCRWVVAERRERSPPLEARRCSIRNLSILISNKRKTLMNICVMVQSIFL
jgi:hypothetical protein